MLGIEGIIIVGAAGTLLGVALSSGRFFLPRRVRDCAATNEGIRNPESAVCGNPGSGRPGRVRGPGAPDPGRGMSVTTARELRHEPALDAYMPAAEHIERFVSWAVVGPGGRPRKLVKTHEAMFDFYLDWTMSALVVPLPEKTFQTLLAKHEQVARKREPLKDPATGRILRKPSGVPERETRYTINLPRVRPVLPGTVPVCELVPKRPLESKTQRAAKKAAAQHAGPQAGQPGQPLPEEIAA